MAEFYFCYSIGCYLSEIHPPSLKKNDFKVCRWPGCEVEYSLYLKKSQVQILDLNLQHPDGGKLKWRESKNNNTGVKTIPYQFVRP